MNVHEDSKNLKQQINMDIDYIKKMLRDSYDNLDIMEKSNLEVGEVVLFKDSLDKGIIRGFSVGSTNISKVVNNNDRIRYIQVHVVCLKGEITTKIENLVVYSDAAKILYSKKVPIIKDEIPY